MSVLIPRSMWGSTFDYAARHRTHPASAAKVETCLHHSVTVAPDLEPPFDDEYRAMRLLEAIGKQRFGSGMSYNAAVMPSGRAYEGQPLDNKSTNSDYGDWNYTRAAIVLVGNYDKQHLTAAQQETIAAIQAEWRKAGLIERTDLRWHSQTKPTGCPGKNAVAAIPAINARTKALLATKPKPIVKLSLLATAAVHGDRSYPDGTLTVQRALRKEGLLTPLYIPGRFGAGTRKAYARWQQRLGYSGGDANGIPGNASLTRLGNKRGFVVR